MAEENRSAAPEQELSEILQIRRDKLKALQDAGRDPFQITRFDRTVWSADILEHYEDYEGKTVSVSGRMMSRGKEMGCLPPEIPHDGGAGHHLVF